MSNVRLDARRLFNSKLDQKSKFQIVFLDIGRINVIRITTGRALIWYLNRRPIPMIIFGTWFYAEIEKKKKAKIHPNTKFPLAFDGRNKNQ